MKIKEDANRHEWISVKERLPEVWEHVLAVVGLRGIVEAAVYDGVKWKVAWNHDELTDVTHWMPLPEPPEVKE